MDPYGPEGDQVRALIVDVLDEGPIDSDDGNEEDAVIVSDHDTSSEQEGDEDNEEETSESYYLGKDGITKWRKEIPRPNVRTRSQNIITHLPGVVGDA